MYLKLFASAAICAALACASGGQSDGSSITVVVENEYPSTVTAYAVWDSRRIRLGEVSRNRTRTFSTPRRGDQVAIGLEVLGSPPGGTTAGPSRFGGGGGVDPSSPVFVSEAIMISPGEGISWRLEANGTLLFLRIPPSS